MPRRLLPYSFVLLLVSPPIMATLGWLVVASFLQPGAPARLTPRLIREADASFAHSLAQARRFQCDPRAGWRRNFSVGLHSRCDAHKIPTFLGSAVFNLSIAEQNALWAQSSHMPSFLLRS